MSARDESEAVELCRRGAFDQATTWIVRGYGQEILTYLCSIERSPDEAKDIFSELCAALWQSLPSFRFECSLRTYAYSLARRLWARAVRTRVRRAEVPTPPQLEEVAQQVRTATAEYLRTAARDRLDRLRDQLDDDERTLLILRLKRKLSWLEIARIMSDGDDDDLSKSAASLRKRYERIKEQLRHELRDPSD